MSELIFLSEIGILTAFFLFLSGVIKGSIGFGQPLVAISLLTLIHDIEFSLALISLSLVATNLKLALSGESITKTLNNYRYVIATIVIGTATGVAVISYVNKSAVQIVLGVLVIGFVLMGVFKFEMKKVNPSGLKGSLIGLIAGLIGGITSAFGPLLAAFLKSQQLEKGQFVSTLCILILAGATTLSVSLGVFAIYSADRFFYAVLACIPTFAGLWLGEKIRQRINADMFFNIVSMAILVTGINLVRIGIIGVVN